MPQMTIWSMRIACWIPKVMDTHSEHVTLIVIPLQQWLNESTSMLRLYVHYISSFNFASSVLRKIKPLMTERSLQYFRFYLCSLVLF
jgi:hypothetical protein